MHDRAWRLNTIILGGWSWLPAGDGHPAGNVPNFFSIRELQRVLRSDLAAINNEQPFAPLKIHTNDNTGPQRGCLATLITLPIFPLIVNRDRKKIRRARMNQALLEIDVLRQEVSNGRTSRADAAAFIRDALEIFANPLRHQPQTG